MQATLDEEQSSAQLMRQQITTELAAVDRQEENLLDLAAGGTQAGEKIQTRLTRLAGERKRLKGRLGEDGEQLREGALVLARQLELLFHPGELYRQLDDLGRRLLNQAVFEELLIDVDEMEPRVTGATYTEPVRGLMEAHQAYGQEMHTTTQLANDRRPTVAGRPSERTLTDLLRIPHVEVWSKAVMVEHLGRCARWTSWTKRLPDLQKHRRTSSSVTPTRPSANRQLSAEQVAKLITQYRDGETVYELAERFKIHRTTVSEHLRRQGVMIRRRGLEDEQVRLAVHLYQANWSLARIGERLSVDAHTVWSALLKQGVRMRDTHGRER